MKYLSVISNFISGLTTREINFGMKIRCRLCGGSRAGAHRSTFPQSCKAEKLRASGTKCEMSVRIHGSRRVALNRSQSLPQVSEQKNYEGGES